MNRTAIIYWSGTGNTEAMAMAILDGAKQVKPETECFIVSEITPSSAAEYDTLILGCPAMGAETLEESEFEPFFAELEKNLSGKKAALFGSYGWGDGEWMREWEERIMNANAKLIGDEGLIVNEMPDRDSLELCRALGKTAASA